MGHSMWQPKDPVHNSGATLPELAEFGLGWHRSSALVCTQLRRLCQVADRRVAQDAEHAESGFPGARSTKVSPSITGTMRPVSVSARMPGLGNPQQARKERGSLSQRLFFEVRRASASATARIASRPRPSVCRYRSSRARSRPLRESASSRQRSYQAETSTRAAARIWASSMPIRRMPCSWLLMRDLLRTPPVSADSAARERPRSVSTAPWRSPSSWRAGSARSERT